MNKLRQMVEAKKGQLDMSYENMAHWGGISMNQFHIVLRTGFTPNTTKRVITAFAKVLGMEGWELWRELEEGVDERGDKGDQ